MGIVTRVRTNLDDIRLFGPMVVTRHLGRFRKSNIVKLNINGTPIHVRAGDSDIAAVRQVFGKREYDLSWLSKAWKRLQDRYEAILAEGGTPVVVDAGANIGTATLWFKKLYPKAAIVAIEPDPDNARVLRMNAEGLPDVHILEAAIGAEKGFVALKSEGMGWAVQTERATQGIPIVTVDDAVAQVKGGVPFIAKIDIEGFERDLFSENVDWIDGMVAVIVEPHDWMLQGEYTSVPLQRAMGSRKFEMYSKGENIFYIR